MLSVGVFRPPCARSITRRRLSISASSSINIFRSDFSASQLSFPLSSFSLERTGVRLFALNKRRNGGGGNANGVVMEEEDDDFEGEDVDDGEDGEDLDVVVSFDELGGWLKRKPRGFGEGKEYDTSLEEKLLEEIEQSKKAQLANIKKLKGSSSDPKKQLSEETEAVPSGASVRISNLPKKRNIERDLKAAFKGIPGIVNITPLVSGNKKTKDPVCKGLAFVNFKSPEDAKRFIDTFSSQTVMFGKVDKQIKCELLDNTRKASEKTLNDPPVEGESNASSGDEGELDESWDSESGDEDVLEGSESLNVSDVDEIERIEQKLLSMAPPAPSTASKGRTRAATKVKSKGRSKGKSDASSGDEVELLDESWDSESGDEDVLEGFESLNVPGVDDIDRIEQKLVSMAPSAPSTASKGRTRAATKVKSKGRSKGKSSAPAKVPKISAAAKRLQPREKAMLADVFSRYGSKMASSPKES